MELTQKNENQLVFTASGYLWNGTKTDRNMISGGQCLDTIQETFNTNKKIKEIVKLWEKWHLNDMHAGTPKQERFLKDNGIKNWASNFTNVCNILKENNLYNDNGYNFGSGWLYEEIDKQDLQQIKKIMGVL